MLISFENTIDQPRLQTAWLRLQELEIRDPQLVEQILEDTQRVTELFSFLHKLKIGEVKATTRAVPRSVNEDYKSLQDFCSLAPGCTVTWEPL